MQPSLFDRQVQIELARTQHGGDVRRGQRKLERPVSTRRPMHLVLASHRARGPLSLRKHDPAVREVLRRMARRFEIRIYDFANVGSHLHLVLRARRREAFQGFLRSFAGIVASRVMGAERGRRTGRFFDGLAWTRVMNSASLRAGSSSSACAETAGDAASATGSPLLRVSRLFRWASYVGLARLISNRP